LYRPKRKSGGYKTGFSHWKTHTYKRRSIKHDFLTFCGWDRLEELIAKIDEPLTKVFVCCLFETGGRASEVLTLTPQQLDIDHKQKIIMIRKMVVLKYRQKEYLKDRKGKFKIDKDKKRKFKWVRKDVYRTFPILLHDPLVKPILDYLDVRKPFRNELIFPYRYHYFYNRIRDLEKPEGAKWGEWWPHRFRGERATQLIMEAGFSVFDLMKWFGWARTDTPTGYVKLTAKELVEKIVKGSI